MIDFFRIGDDTNHREKVGPRLKSLTAPYGELDDPIK